MTHEDMLIYENMKPKLTLQVLNRKRNPEIEETCPHYFWGDGELVVFPIALWMFDDGKSALMKVTHKVVESWDVSEEIIFRDATRNLEKTTIIQPLGDFLGKYVEGYRYNCVIDIFIMSNKKLCYGASHLLDVPSLITFANKQIAKQVVIIPSSIHEVLLVPIHEGDEDDKTLVDAIREAIPYVNKIVVEEKEQLSNRPYIFGMNKYAQWGYGVIPEWDKEETE